LKRSFSFTEKPIHHILDLLPTILPGIEKIVAIFWELEKEKLDAILLKRVDNGYQRENFSVSDTTSILSRFRLDNAPYTWLRIEDLPFDFTSQKKVQLNIFNELNNNILLIRIKNHTDEKNDLYFFYFNTDLSNFGSINPNKILSTDNKTIIAHLLRNSILSHQDIIEEDRKLYEILLENTRNIQHETKGLKSELGFLHEKVKNAILHLCMSYLEEFSRSHERNYQFSKLALEKLSGYTGAIDELKWVIGNAARYADTLASVESGSDTVIISDYHIFPESIQVKPDRVQESTSGSEPEIPAKYEKTLFLLEKMEGAAKQLKAKNILLTSINLGKEMPKPISAPAISDALKKHRKKILYLFDKFPDRWGVIRKEFRPVQNILNVKPELEKNTG
jgi:hypothetical protein